MHRIFLFTIDVAEFVAIDNLLSIEFNSSLSSAIMAACAGCLLIKRLS
jgi:hypothetical protein